MSPPFSTPDELLQLSEAELTPVEEFRKAHHTAVLVMMFTDLKGSTELAERHGEVYAQQIRQTHNAIVREIVTHGDAGRIVKTIGDATFCVFAEPTAAVERALAIQARLEQYNAGRGERSPLAVRIGMHMGQVAVDDSVQRDIFGRHVNRAKRVEELAHGGQVLVTLPVYDSARGWLTTPNSSWRDHGDYQVKGIDESVRVYEALRAGLTPRRPRGQRARWNRALVGGCVAMALVLGGWLASTLLGPTTEIIVMPAREVTNPDLEEPTSTGEGIP
jgi:class 3 adenylate cyclase